MVSIKIKLRHSSVSGVPGTVVYVLHEGMRSVRIATEYKLFPEEWDEKSQSVVFREKISVFVRNGYRPPNKERCICFTKI